MSIDVVDKSNKAYLVLGAPGTATSFISKMLEENGVDMHNEKGNAREPFYEDTKFVRLNTQILQKAGGDWVDTPSEEAIMAADMDKNIKQKIRHRKGKSWGFKDPRLSLTVRKYFPHLEDDVYLICCFRKPKKLMESWDRSKKVTIDKRKLLNRINSSVISAIKEFCEL